MSKEYKKYKRHLLTKSIIIHLVQVLILVGFVALWEILAQTNKIDTFILSCPSKIWHTLKLSILDGTMIHHASVTLLEAIQAFAIATSLGFVIAIILWWNETIRRILDPYIVVLNSLPKVALGPIIILIMGVGSEAIICMAVLIMVVISILNMLSAFCNIDNNKILLLKSMGASKLQILIKLILPGTLVEFISLLKINVGLTWVGTIMGEYLVSRAGLGYLIVNGSQVFQQDLVMTSTFVLCVLASVMYLFVSLLERYINKRMNR